MRIEFIEYNGGHGMKTPAELLEIGVPEALVELAVNDAIIGLAMARIDKICDRVYTAFASRSERYAQKYAEALKYIDAGSPSSVSEADYPYLVNEAPARDLTKADLAVLIIDKATAFNAFGAKAEAARAELLTGVADADGIDAKRVAGDLIVKSISDLAGE